VVCELTDCVGGTRGVLQNRLKAQQEAQAAKNGPQVPAAEMMVTVNNKLWKVPGGMYVHPRSARGSSLVVS
jgi:hypothetical protein